MSFKKKEIKSGVVHFVIEYLPADAKYVINVYYSGYSSWDYTCIIRVDESKENIVEILDGKNPGDRYKIASFRNSLDLPDSENYRVADINGPDKGMIEDVVEILEDQKFICATKKSCIKDMLTHIDSSFNDRTQIENVEGKDINEIVNLLNNIRATQFKEYDKSDIYFGSCNDIDLMVADHVNEFSLDGHKIFGVVCAHAGVAKKVRKKLKEQGYSAFKDTDASSHVIFLGLKSSCNNQESEV
ncbi:MAG: hypothetical protein K2M62_04575 [Muribaculaceae bacterium]|nr:hypothetical protein [Muribaculaceae bacterium]